MRERHEPDMTRDGTEREVERPLSAKPPADREVPLPGVSAADAAPGVIDRWLDGEASEAEARVADSRRVDFWQRVHLDAAYHRAVKAPLHLVANVMAAIPVREPSAQIAKPAVAPERRPDNRPEQHR